MELIAISVPPRVVKLMREFLRQDFICFFKHTIFGDSVPRN